MVRLLSLNRKKKKKTKKEKRHLQSSEGGLSPSLSLWYGPFPPVFLAFAKSCNFVEELTISSWGLSNTHHLVTLQTGPDKWYDSYESYKW